MARDPDEYNPFASAFCSVCQQSTPAVRYGVLSCASCAAFFKRVNLRARTEKCNFEGHCKITTATRSQCRACRFQKCLQVGMSFTMKVFSEKRMIGFSQNEVTTPYKRLLTQEPVVSEPLPVVHTGENAVILNSDKDEALRLSTSDTKGNLDTMQTTCHASLPRASVIVRVCPKP